MHQRPVSDSTPVRVRQMWAWFTEADVQSISNGPAMKLTRVKWEMSVHATLVACRERGSLLPAISYFEVLVAELDSVTYQRPKEEVTFGACEPRCLPRVVCGEVKVGAWLASDHPDDGV
jgi:hypothetical protein